MDSLQKVYKWLDDMQYAIDLEDDLKEKRLLWEHRNSVEINIKYYISRQLEEGAEHFFCSDCGKIEFATYIDSTKNRLIEKQKCFHCDFHEEREKEYLSGKKPTLIIDGVTYSDGGKTKGSNTAFNGFGGAVFKIRMLDGSKEWETNNLWCGGDIPKKYRLTTMKDNAEFVKEVSEFE